MNTALQPAAPITPLSHAPVSTVRLAVLSMLAALMTACGGGGGGDDAASSPTPSPSTTGTVNVTASLGAVANADVSVTCAPSGAVLGTGSTGASGEVAVGTSGSCSGPLLVTVSARADGSSTYFDEALSAVVAFPAGSSLRAVVASQAATLSLGVTALTEIAARQALAAAGGLGALTAAQVNSANSAVVTQVLGSGVSLDILTPPTPWTASTAAGSLGTSAAERYAFYLAGLARMGTGAATPALAATSALADDLADGTLSGSSSGFVYTAGGLAAQRSAALNAMASYANAGLQSDLGVAPPSALVASGFSPASGAAGDTITISGSGFDPDPFHVLVKFSNNLTAEVVSSSDGAVVVKVPAGAVSGPITVTNTLRFQTASTGSFTVTEPATGGTGGGGGGTTASWVSRASPTRFLLSGLAYGNGRFVAVGFNRNLVTSTDGLSWTEATPPDSNYFEGKSVVWTGSQFVMVGDKVFGSSTPALIATSPDGLSWTRRAWTPDACCEPGALTDAAAGAGRITLAGGSLLMSSADGGVSWSRDSLPTGVFPNVAGLAGNDTTRVAVGNQSGTPTILVDTGTGWRLAEGTLDRTHMPADVTWTGTQFVAVGGRAVMRSADGVTWTTAVLPDTALPTGIFLTTVRAVGTVLYATGDNFSNKLAILQSDDAGVTWRTVHQETTNGIANLPGMAASPDRIVTVGGVKSVTLP